MKMVVKLKANVAVGGLKFPQLTCEWLGKVLDTGISAETRNNMSETSWESQPDKIIDHFEDLKRESW